MSRRAARAGDYITCDMAPKATEVGVIFIGESQIRVNGRPAARAGDTTLCSADGELSTIKRGSMTVRIGGKPAARQFDITNHKNQRISSGSANVLIGDLESTLADCPMLSGGYYHTTDQVKQRIYDARRLPRSPLAGPALGTYTFPGSSGPMMAWYYHVTIDGKTFRIIVPAGGSRPSQVTPEQVADALAALGAEERAKTDTVVISPDEDPQNKQRQEGSHNPRHRSAATASDGLVTFYAPAGGSQTLIDDYMQHEAAHNIDNELLWKDPANREAWERAIEADGRPVPAYGETDAVEDFAESVKMYNLTKGTPCEAKGRARFPARYAELDRLFRATPSSPSSS